MGVDSDSSLITVKHNTRYYEPQNIVTPGPFENRQVTTIDEKCTIDEMRINKNIITLQNKDNNGSHKFHTLCPQLSFSKTHPTPTFRTILFSSSKGLRHVNRFRLT